MNSENAKPKKKQQHNYSKVFEVFVGSTVTIMIRSSNPNSESGISNMMFSGYLLDECNTFFYLGAEVDEIQAAINKSEIVSILAGEGVLSEEQDIDIPEGSSIQ